MEVGNLVDEDLNSRDLKTTRLNPDRKAVVRLERHPFAPTRGSQT